MRLERKAELAGFWREPGCSPLKFKPWLHHLHGADKLLNALALRCGTEVINNSSA